MSKGQLPLSVKSTTVSKKFGITRNPLYGTRTEHPGINIVTRAGEEVRVVSDGYVFAIQPYQDMVMWYLLSMGHTILYMEI